MVLQSNANQKLKVLTILFIVFIVLRHHLTPAKVRNGAFRHQINYVAQVQDILNFKEYKKLYHWYKVYSNFAKCVDFAY